MIEYRTTTTDYYRETEKPVDGMRIDSVGTEYAGDLISAVESDTLYFADCIADLGYTVFDIDTENGVIMWENERREEFYTIVTVEVVAYD